MWLPIRFGLFSGLSLFLILQCHGRPPDPGPPMKSVGHHKKVDEKSKKPVLGKDLRQKDQSKIRLLMKKKDLAMKKLDKAIEKFDSADITVTLSPGQQLQVSMFKLFQMELNQTEAVILQSYNWLKDVINSNYEDLNTMKEKGQVKLDMLRDATMKEETEMNAIGKAQAKLSELNHTKIAGVIDEILRDVALAADQLEDDLNDHVFDDAIEKPKHEIEAVLKIHEGGADSKSNSTDKSPKLDAGIIKLVDAEDNQFVLAKGKDSTIPHEDHHLIKDMVVLIILSTVCGWACVILHLPTMFGYVVSGIVLGPSGLNHLKSLVQIETVGEFGVFFILFAVGLEFSPAKLKKVFKVASIGSTLMTLFMVLGGLLCGHFVGANPNESIFVSACLSLSSTPLIVKFLGPENSESSQGKEYGSILLGILVMQDVLLGLLMALLPNMVPNADPTAKPANESMKKTIWMYTEIVLKLAGALSLVLIAIVIAAKFLIRPLYKYLVRTKNKELIIMVTVVIVFLVLMFTDQLEISMELGCFLAGVLVSSQGHELAEQIENLTQPIKDFLGCLFFSSIGLHVFPTFLAYEITILQSLTLFVVGSKFLIGAIVLSCVLPKSSKGVKWVVSAGLAQVSEFSFVLGSRARRLGLISREVYLLILSVTTMSLLLAPVLWRFVLWQQRIPKANSSSKQNNGPTSEENVSTISPFEKDLEVDVSSLIERKKGKSTLSRQHSL